MAIRHWLVLRVAELALDWDPQMPARDLARRATPSARTYDAIVPMEAQMTGGLAENRQRSGLNWPLSPGSSIQYW